MIPSDFSSLANDVDLTAANYSGGTGGTFGDAVQGAGVWQYQGVTPVFETRAGIEGLTFSGLSTDALTGYAMGLHEATVIVIAQPDTGTQDGLIGGTNSSNTWWGSTNSNRLFTRSPSAVSADTVADATNSTQPAVFSMGFSPRTGRLYAQINNGTLAVGQSSGTSMAQAAVRSAPMGIGTRRTSYFNGWISRVHIFSRCLQERDPSGFASLVANRMALIGL